MNKNVIITGSSRGIGFSTAYILAKAGYTIILHCSKETPISKTSLKKIKQFSPCSNIFYFDLSKKEEIIKGCKKILRQYKKIYACINNAGITRDKTLMKLENDDWNKVINTNLNGTFYLIKSILPAMVNNGEGRIINISSVVAQTGNFGQTNYAASKAGLIGLTKSLSLELARNLITVNAIAPGFTNTQMISQIPEKILNEKILPKIPLKRLCEPEEIAHLIKYLLSKHAGYITGSVININGGLL